MLRKELASERERDARLGISTLLTKVDVNRCEED